MFKKFLQNFDTLPISNKAMVYLMWIYGIGELISSIFVNIYVFKVNRLFENIIIYNIIFFTSTFIGFSLLWWIMSILGKNIKNMYYISYTLFILSFLELFFLKWTLSWVYIFWCLFALGNWAFWNAVHTQELKNIENKNRDFYSSSISAGRNIISIFSPLLIAFVFYISEIFHFDGYVILFLFLPFVYLFSFVFISDIDSYIPSKIRKVDFKNFFNLKKYKYGHCYFLIWGLKHSLNTAIIPIINIILLKNETNIWIFQGILTIISTFLIVHLSHKRKEETRFQYFFIISFLLFLSFIFFWFYFNLVAFAIFSLIGLFLNPIYRVSEHVYDLSLMDSIKVEWNDFYPAMIMRETILWIGRMLALFILFIFLKSWKFDTENILSLWLILNGILFIFLSVGIYFWEKHEKHL